MLLQVPISRSPRPNSPRGGADVDLLRESAADPEAYGRFYDRHFEAVLGFLYARTGDSEVAADLAAETFVQAFISRRKFKEASASARPWLFGIARFKLMRTLRTGKTEARARRRLGFETPLFDDAAAARTEGLVDAGALRAELREALGGLQPEMAKAVYLRIGLELPYEEVARQLDCSEGAARLRVMRGLTRLRDAMEVTL